MLVAKLEALLRHALEALTVELSEVLHRVLIDRIGEEKDLEMIA